MTVGSSSRRTSKRSWIYLSVSLSLSVLTKEIARPLVPKRPARPTLCKYESASRGMSKLNTMLIFSISMPRPKSSVATRIRVLNYLKPS